MNIHEYQAKELFARYGIPVPKGGVASTPEEAARIAGELGGRAVVKAQVHAGGRGQAGGVKLVSSPQEAQDFAAKILGTRLVTYQTGPEGVPVRKVLIEETIDIERELYLAMIIDGSSKGVVAIASEEGGVSIEKVAEETPEKILSERVDHILGFQPFQGRRLAYALNTKPEQVRAMSGLIENLYKVFIGSDCSLVEINPLVITKDGRVLAVDAKINIDDDAVFRHKDIEALRDLEQEDPGEIRAREFGINYVKLGGDVGCIVNGAGLAMATMDVISAAGSTPANFLDIGGGTDEAKAAEALKIVLGDADVKQVLVNIFGGIVRCDVAARGFVMAAKDMPGAARPMVVRLLGTNAEEGRKILAESGLDVTLVDNLAQAADAVRANS
jgi:succinyl-CoA synthetase beta subunit